VSVLVTGGCGYIGSHICVKLLAHGLDVLIVDDLSNSRHDVIERIAQIAGRRPRFARIDIADSRALGQAIEGEFIESVVHLAGRKGVAESVREPDLYGRANLVGTANVRAATKGRPFVFSSSATVYGEPAACPVGEDAATDPTNPYGASKLACERMLIDSARGSPGERLVILRYFNPVGAHESGMLGDDPIGEPQNLMPRIERVAAGLEPALIIHGNDYPTRDGTAIRDYVHVEDIAAAHVGALAAGHDRPLILNLGSEQGATVREIVHAFETATGLPIPTVQGQRRPGDVASLWADATRARQVLGWIPGHTLQDACTDAMRWRRFWSRHLQQPSGHPKS